MVRSSWVPRRLAKVADGGGSRGAGHNRMVAVVAAGV
jgi:hypothetical protein